MKIKIYLSSVALLCIFSFAHAQQYKMSVVQEIKKWQNELDAEYKGKATSPLSAEDIKKFTGHHFFKIDTAFRVIAKIVLTNSNAEIPFKTTTDKIKMHIKYADLHFKIKGQSFVLSVYQSKDLMQIKEYADFLFLPFFDETSGIETYGGGRYIDLRLPKNGNTIIVDFNKAYNPYCAYASGYSCPKVPSENELKIKVLAGVMYENTH